MNYDLMEFSDCLCATDPGKNKHLLLGNGFSISLFPEIFSYKVLASKIKDPKIKKLFNKLDTRDFEYVLEKLQATIEIIKHYDKKSVIVKTIKTDHENLKKILISVIASSHPESPCSINDSKYNSCWRFLNEFKKGRVYSLNYDLILYWVYMHFFNTPRKLPFCDGFGQDANKDKIIWKVDNETSQSLYFPHGALHIFKNKYGDIEKYTWKRTDIKITKQVKGSIDLGEYPVFISEGTSRHKMSRITGNGYLYRSLSSLKSIGGCIFIFGHSLGDNDDHIFRIVNNNKKIKEIFVSVFGNPKSENNQKLIQKVERWKNDYSNKNYFLYKAESAKVWDAN